MDSESWFKVFFAGVVLVNLALLGLGVWAVIEIVTWLTSK